MSPRTDLGETYVSCPDPSIGAKVASPFSFACVHRGNDRLSHCCNDCNDRRDCSLCKDRFSGNRRPIFFCVLPEQVQFSIFDPCM